MRDIRLKARAKINLTLNVTGKREDGYHLLETIMQTISLYDGIYMKRIRKGEILIQSNLPWLPTDQRNLAYKAAALMRETFHLRDGVFIRIDKRIPVAAGLAGGSADCAAVLIGMNRLFSLGLSSVALEALAFQLGSDIPYCVGGGTVLACGVGEKLTPIVPPCPMCHVVLAKLPVSVSTAAVYQALPVEAWETARSSTKAMIEAMAEGEIAKMGKCLGNVLERVTIPMHPRIAEIKRAFIDLGAEGALMSGSGPTVFGLFQDEKQAKAAAAAVKSKFALKEVVATRIYHPKGEEEGDKSHG